MIHVVLIHADGTHEDLGAWERVNCRSNGTFTLNRNYERAEPLAVMKDHAGNIVGELGRFGFTAQLLTLEAGSVLTIGDTQ